MVPLEKGPDSDEFFLTFDAIGASTFNRPPPATPPAPTPVDLAQVASVGVRTFDEISATMAKITGVSELDPAVQGDVRHDPAIAAGHRERSRRCSRRTRSRSRSSRSSTATR